MLPSLLTPLGPVPASFTYHRMPFFLPRDGQSMRVEIDADNRAVLRGGMRAGEHRVTALSFAVALLGGTTYLCRW